MAHEIEVVKGQAKMFWCGETPWHGLGTKLDKPPTIEEGIRAAGLDWTVELKPLYTVKDNGKGELLPDTLVGHRAVSRTSDGSTFGVVGPGYTPLQNVEAFKWFQPLLDAGEVTLHTAGSLQGGKKVWVLAKIAGPSSEIAEGDYVSKFVLLSNSHDGSRAVRAGFTPIRVVCANTLRLTQDTGNAENKLIRLNHTKNVVNALTELRETMKVANSAFEASVIQYRKLAQFKINKVDLRQYVKIVLGIDKEDEKDIATRTMNKLRDILLCCEKGRGNEMPSVRGTLWTAYNGITEYLAYDYGRNADNRADSLWFGVNANLSQQALDLALTMAS